ncbi:MAG: transposase [Candidatus Tectimicrobiota bacterium]|nr:MAG: transposase [Candidatus Tectomicrobia bacterium]
MARQPRLVLPGYPHHVIQRGNNRQRIFFTEADYSFYLACLQQAKLACQCRIYAYVLMTNHVHLIVEPPQAEALGRFMQSVGRRYVRYINATYQRSGTLWEGRFKSAVISRDAYLLRCGRYIELNPVRAGLVTHPAEYRWSSYRCRALGVPDAVVDEDPWYAGLGADAEARCRAYRAWMEESWQAEEWEQIRQATRQGRAIGSEQFQEALAQLRGRRLVRPRRGRPPKPLEENVL